MPGQGATLDFSSMSKHGEKLRNLLEEQALLPGPIVLSNGQKSDFYFDCKKVTLSSRGADLVADAFLAVLDALQEKPQAIGGLTHGADPIIGAVQMRALERDVHYDAFYVRKEPKKHGTKQWIENPPASGTKVVIVDDVVTTGKSVVMAIEKARESGCNVLAVIALVDREQGGADVIRKACPNYHCVYTAKDFPKIKALAQAN